MYVKRLVTLVVPAAIFSVCLLSGCRETPQTASTTLDVANVQGSSFDEPVTSAPAVALATPAPVNSAPANEAETVVTHAPDANAVPVTAETLPDDISKIPTATPVPMVTEATPVPAPAVAAAPVASGDFENITFELLSSFKYEEPIPQDGEKPEDVEKRRNPDQIPANVKALNGKKAVVQGWMVPMEVNEDGSVKSFVLVKTQPQCCFGDMQAMNEWVDVIMQTGKNAEFNVDVPVKVYGQLEVGEKMQDGFVLSVYRMQGERVEL